MKPVLTRAVAIPLLWFACAILGAQVASAPPDLTTLQIEDLMNVDVTSAAKKEQKISRVPAAIFVITQEDIARSGATNVADLLRMVPGLEVAQITPSTWAVSARGFNGQYSNKLLVLIDGLAVYTPIFAGVYWDAQDLTLDSIERVEVIRGPGATVWGANAVNGVISIITKRAEDTQGLTATAHGGTIDHGGGSVRFGGRLGSSTYRVFADGFDMGHFLTPEGKSAEDGWYAFHGGFRADAQIARKDSFTLQGDADRGNEGETITGILSLQPPVNGQLLLRERFSDWHVLARWKHAASADAETSVQVYFDRSNRGDPTYGVGLNTIDLDFQQRNRWRKRHDFVWGLGYRLNADSSEPAFRISFLPANLKSQIFSSFVQDEIALVRDRLYVSLGTKVEHEYYNGFNAQPSARLTWTPGDRETFWAAISGAERTPSRVETAIRYNYGALPGVGNVPTLISVFGNPGQKNEQLIATEAGFRKDVSDKVSFDSTVFFNQYRDLRSSEAGVPRLEAEPAPEHLLVPLSFGNLIHGETHGIELFANVKLASRWTLSPGYAFLTMHLHRDAGGTDFTTGPQAEGGIPNQQAQLRSNVNLPWHLQWTTLVYFVGRLDAQAIPSYTRVDSNVTWQASEKISLGVAGQNLARNLHPEFDGPDVTVMPSLVRRSAYAWLTWRF
jgi:iron complex outermembrane receptor protein